MSEKPTLHPSKKDAYESVRQIFDKEALVNTDNAVVLHGNSLNLLEKMPSDSVSLILTDPPYHTTKKANITGDRDFKEDQDFLSWMEKFAVEWRRVLRSNGTIYLFCSAQMSARLEVLFSKYFRPISHITWTKPNDPGFDGWKGKSKKESLRTWYPHSERILVFEHGQYGSWEADNRSPLGKFLKEMRTKSGLTMNALTEITGAYKKVNHGGAVANWEAGRNIPSREQYEKIKSGILSTNLVERMPDFEDLVRPMKLSNEIDFTDVWNFPSVRPYKGKHPAEKPQDLLEHIISASSYVDDVILDCFSGSGAAGNAAISLGRKAILIDIDAQWAARSAQRVTGNLKDYPLAHKSVITGASKDASLFDL